jgi:hypothetical protein
MIVEPAIFEAGRTIWKFASEPNDRPVPRRELWIGGSLHRRSADIEALWLALSLGPFVGNRLVLPCAAARLVYETLQSTIGASVVPTTDCLRAERDPLDREFSADLIRDPVDRYLSSLARQPAQFSIEVHSDPGHFGYGSSAFHIPQNAGTLRRYIWPLDCGGELAALWMLCPMLFLRRLTAFLCAEELVGISAMKLARLAEATGTVLCLPFAGVSARALGRVLMDLGLPAIACFRGLWNRFRMFPGIMGEIYRDLEPFLDVAEADPVARISRYMAEAYKDRETEPSAAAGFDEAFFTLGKRAAQAFPQTSRSGSTPPRDDLD